MVAKIKLDLSGSEALRQKYKTPPTLKVGFFAGSEKTKIAIINEFGATIPVTDKMRRFFRWKFKVNLRADTTSITIPPRAFMRQTFDKHNQEWLPWLNWELSRSKSLEDALDSLGGVIRGQIVDTIFNGDFVENSQITAREKGFNQPLIRSKGGAGMVDSVAYEVK